MERPVFNSPAIRWTTRAEVEAELEKDANKPAVDIIRADCFTIESWPDYSFEADGRKFSLFVDGVSIAHRLAARDFAGMQHRNITQRKAELDEIAGFILDDEAPIMFKDHNELVKAWTDLHGLFGVPLSQQERDELCIDEPEDSEDSDAR